jgi:hypothetical protein
MLNQNGNKYLDQLEICVEDTLLTIKDEEPKKTGGGSGGSKVSDYKSCPETLPIAKFCKNETIRKVQGCLGITADGLFGPKTQTALEAKGVDGTLITQQTVDKVCNQQDVVSGEEPEVSGEDITINSNDANF